MCVGAPHELGNLEPTREGAVRVHPSHAALAHARPGHLPARPSSLLAPSLQFGGGGRARMRADVARRQGMGISPMCAPEVSARLHPFQTGRAARAESLLSRSQMALISSQLQWLEAELESAIEECGQVVEQNNAWLAETIQKNTKNLQYQTCARSPWGRGGRARGGRGSRACVPASEPPQPSPSRRRNPSLECPRSQRKPVRRGRQKAMAAVTVRLPAQPVRRTRAR